MKKVFIDLIPELINFWFCVFVVFVKGCVGKFLKITLGRAVDLADSDVVKHFVTVTNEFERQLPA